MQRQLYPALLMITIALAVAVYMRPTLGEELMGLAGALTGHGGGGQESPRLPAPFTLLGRNQAAPSTTQVAAAGSVPWPGTPVGRAFTSDTSSNAALPGPHPPDPMGRYAYRPGTGALETDPSSAFRPTPIQESVAEAAPPSYPIAGQSQRMPTNPAPVRAIGSTYPTAGEGAGVQRPAGPNPLTHSGAGAAPVSGHAGGDGETGMQPGPPLPQYGAPQQYQMPAGNQPAVEYQPPPRYFAPPDQEEKPDYPDPSARHSAPPAHEPLGPTRPPHGRPVIPPEAQFAAGPPVVAEVKPCVGAQILAVVGNEVILASEVMPDVERMIAGVPESELAKLSKRQLEVQKKALAAKLLQTQIETKLIHQDALRTIPAEGLANIEERIADHFDKKELPARIKKEGVTTRRELDEKLHAVGTSVERTKKAFINRTLAVQWMRQSNDLEAEVSHDRMLDYYREHLAEFETPARARWETITVRIPRYTDGSEARAKLAHLGDQVMRGVSMADALKAQPPGDPECRGGAKGWTTREEVQSSPTIEQALFGLPVGSLSQILQDRDGLHIVRVLEREPARRTPFEEAQVEIREKIKELDRDKELQAYLARLKTQIPVWTAFDDDPDLAELRRQSEAS